MNPLANARAVSLPSKLSSADPWPILRRQLERIPLFWALQCGGWLAFGLAMFAWGLDFLSPRDAFVNKALLVATGFGLTLIFRALYRRSRARSLTPLASVAFIFFLSFAGAAAWRETQSLLFQLYVSMQLTGTPSAELVAIPVGTLMYDGFVLFVWSLLYHGVKDWAELEKQRNRAARAEAMAQAARLRALQSQLEPHFLFNTLNAISTLVVEGQNASASRMIARLSDFLRLSLDTIDTPEVSIAEELEFVRRYLEIEQVRFGDRLQVAIEASPDTMQGLVPVLVLQPLVENAVKHGVLQREGGGSIKVTVARTNGRLRLCVADDGPGPSGHAPVSRAVGLSNTATRLAELHGDKSSFCFGPSADGGAAAVIEIPFRTAVSPYENSVT